MSMSPDSTRTCSELCQKLWPRSDWAGERYDLFESEIASYDLTPTLRAIKEHATKYNQQPSFKVLIAGIRNASNVAHNARGSTLTAFDAEKGCRVQWFVHPRIWTLYTDMRAMVRKDGSEREWGVNPITGENYRDEKTAELESLGVCYEELLADHGSWSRTR